MAPTSPFLRLLTSRLKLKAVLSSLRIGIGSIPVISPSLLTLTRRRILVLIVPMAATEMSQSLIPTLSAYAFNLRTRSLNSVIYWLVQIPSTFLYGAILDNTRFRRRTRGLMGLSIGLVIVMANWGLVLGLQLKYNLKRDMPSPQWDWTDPVYGKFVVMILLAGISLAIDQMAVMWILGAFSNEPRLLARYGGFFKAMLSAGLCLAFGLEAGSVSYVLVALTWLYSTA